MCVVPASTASIDFTGSNPTGATMPKPRLQLSRPDGKAEPHASMRGVYRKQYGYILRNHSGQAIAEVNLTYVWQIDHQGAARALYNLLDAIDNRPRPAA